MLKLWYNYIQKRQINSKLLKWRSENFYEKENNYIGSLYSFGYGYAFTYSDITTGDIYSSLYNSNSDIIYKLLSLYSYLFYIYNLLIYQ